MEYQFESIGPALRWVVLAFLFVSVIAAVAAVAAIAAVPGWIARRRQRAFAKVKIGAAILDIADAILTRAILYGFKQRVDRFVVRGRRIGDIMRGHAQAALKRGGL